MRPLIPLVLTVGLAAPAFAGGVLPFVQDDHARALAEARERQVPLFVENWAPW